MPDVPDPIPLETPLAATPEAPPVSKRSKRRDLVELGVGFALILVVIWTPRPLQRWLWMVAAAFVLAAICMSWDGFRPMGLRITNLLRSLWVVGFALAVAGAAVLLAERMHTLNMPAGPIPFVERYGAYMVWAFVQQLLLQSFFLTRSVRLLPGANSAAILAAFFFAVAHLPNPILTVITLFLGLASCLVFLRYQNLYSLAVAHAILGIAIAITIPGPVHHNMRVGLGYLTYVPRPAPLGHPVAQLPKP